MCFCRFKKIIAGILIGFGIGVLLVLFLPPIAWICIMGIGTVAAYLVDKFEQLPIKEFLLLATTNPALFTSERMMAISELIIAGSKALGYIVQYLSGSDKSRQTVELATDTLIEIEKKINPELDDNEAYKTVLSYGK